jgi:metallophosphoesterase superfamily enzyme
LRGLPTHWSTHRVAAGQGHLTKPYYRPDLEHRGAAIYAARRAEAYLALGDHDAAIETARDANTHMTGVSSDRSTNALATLHGHLTQHRNQPAVHAFLEAVPT